MAHHEQSTAAMTPQEFADTQFRIALEYNPDGFTPQPTEGFCGALDAFSFDDVAEVVAYSEGEHDCSRWLAVLILRDQRLIYVTAGCDNTGWDCCGDMVSVAAASLDDLVRWGLSPEERERLGLSLAEAGEKDRAIRDAHERHARLLADGVPKDAPERVACEAELHALLGTQPVAELTDAQKAVAKAAVDELLGD